MKIFTLVGALVFTVIILILSFENIQASCNYLRFFFAEISNNTPPTFVIFGVALLGMIAGGFYMAFIQSILKGGEEEEDEGI